MVSMNHVTIAGHLTRDPDLRSTSRGAGVAAFGVAVNERFSTRDGEDREQVCFVEVEVWGRQADWCGRNITKGAPVLVEGKLQSDRWEDRETGRPRTRVKIRARRVQFLGAFEGRNESSGFSRMDTDRTPRGERGARDGRRPARAQVTSPLT